MRKDEFNIYEFHQKLYMKRDALDHINIKQRIKHIQKLLSQETKYQHEVKYQQDIKELEQQLLYINEYEEYKNNLDYVDQFQELLNDTVRDSFVKKKNQTQIHPNIIKKQQLIYDYLQQLNQYPILYSLLPAFKEELIKNMCSDCKVELISFEQNYICPTCFQEQAFIYQDEFSFRDLSRINTNIKYSYIRQTHFKDTIKQFQGKQNKYIHPQVYTTLHQAFEQSWIKQNANGKYSTISKDHIKIYLQENGLFKYYEDINLIYSELTGIPCPDISEYEKQLMEDFNKLIQIYDKVIKESNYERSNFLNSYYILFQLLKKNGYQCKETDFPIIKTIERKIEHDEIYEKCCKQLGWIFFPTV